MSFLSKKHQTPIAYILTFSIITYITSVILQRAWPLLLFSLVLVFTYIRLPKILHTIPTVRLLASIFVLLSLFQLESVLFWVFRIAVNPFVYNIVSLLLIILAASIQRRRGVTPNPISRIRFSRLDLLLILPALLLTGSLWARVILPKKDDNIAIVQSITYGMDDATHAGMFSGLLRNNVNLFAGQKTNSLLPTSVDTNYPMGWHVSMAVVTSSIFKTKDKTVMDFVRLYFYAKLFTFFALIVMVSIFCLSLYKRLDLNIKSIIDYALFVISAAFISIILFLPLYLDGFFSFLPIISYLLLLVSIFISTARDEKSSSDVIFCLLAVASALTWILTAPILIIAAIATKIHSSGSIKKIPRTFYIYTTAATLAFIFEVYILLSANKNIISNIAALGGIQNPTHILLLITLSVFIYFYMTSKKYVALARELSLFIIPTALLLLAVLLYISLKSQVITYYYFKFQVVLLAILLPLACVLLTKKILERSSNNIFDKVTAIALVIIVFGLSIPSVIGYEYFSTTIHKTRYYDLQDADATRITQSLERPFTKDNPRLFIFYPDRQILMTAGLSVNRLPYPESSCDDNIIGAIYQDQLTLLGKYLITCSQDLPHITINTDSQGYAQLKMYIPHYLIDNNTVSIVNTDQ